MKKKRISTIIKNFIRRPDVTLVIGVILIICGIFETTDTFLESFLKIDIGAGHGILFIGMVQILHSIVITIEGLENVGVANEEKELEHDIKEDKTKK